MSRMPDPGSGSQSGVAAGQVLFFHASNSSRDGKVQPTDTVKSFAQSRCGGGAHSQLSLASMN
eukprot:7333706-Prymnesium_polylepis.1